MLNRNISRSTPLLAALVLTATIWTGCEGNEEEQAALSVVTDGVDLLENQEARQALRLTTADFVAHPGRLDKTAVLRRLASVYHAHGDLEILFPEPEIEVRESGKSALITAPFVVATRDVSQDIVDALDALRGDLNSWEAKASEYTAVEHAELSLVKENDRWLVSAVRL